MWGLSKYRSKNAHIKRAQISAYPARVSSPLAPYMMSMVSGIQGQLLEATVVGCSKLKDTEWISRQDPYVCLEYATTKFRTRTCTDGGKHPIFQEKTVIPLIEGLREITVTVWNSNSLTFDDFIGSGRVQLLKVLSQGYDDSSWSLQSKSGKYAGEVKIILHYPNAQKARKPTASYASPAPVYMSPHVPYAAPPAGYPPMKSVAAPVASYPNPAEAYPPAGSMHYPASSVYPIVEPAPYPHASTYPPHMMMGYPLQQQTYPPQQQTYPPAYPPQTYPPPPSAHAYPPGPFPGIYPPPPY